jgi:hypothetical protein
MDPILWSYITFQNISARFCKEVETSEEIGLKTLRALSYTRLTLTKLSRKSYRLLFGSPLLVAEDRTYRRCITIV